MTKHEQALQKLVEQQEKLIDQLLLQGPPAPVYYPAWSHNCTGCRHCRPIPYWEQWTVTSGTTTTVTDGIPGTTWINAVDHGDPIQIYAGS